MVVSFAFQTKLNNYLQITTSQIIIQNVVMVVVVTAVAAVVIIIILYPRLDHEVQVCL